MSMARIGIVGAGLAGLTCARGLAAAGLAPVVLDKGRGVGGRLATRRADGGVRFDHGAPYLTARDAGFGAMLAEAVAAGALARWDGPLRPADAGATAHVGVPGMSALARHLGDGLDLRQGQTVSAVEPGRDGVSVRLDDGSAMVFDRLVLALPAPQILRLLPAGHGFAPALAAVRMDPCLTVMAAFAEPPRKLPPVQDDLFDWIGGESAKPGRARAPQAWVAQAGPDASRAALELELPAIADRLLPELAARLGLSGGTPVHVAGHRWRFARVAAALGQPCLADQGAGLFAGGDWCLGPQAEDAWASGQALGQAVLASLHRA